MLLQGGNHMVAKSVPGVGASNEAGNEARLNEALARMKSATDRRAALIDVLSRVGVSAQDKRSAQAESKKIDRDLRDAKRLLDEAQALVRKEP
jgi:hypothetical protein